jgi:hypothetical protein
LHGGVGLVNGLVPCTGGLGIFVSSPDWRTGYLVKYNGIALVGFVKCHIVEPSINAIE